MGLRRGKPRLWPETRLCGTTHKRAQLKELGITQSIKVRGATRYYGWVAITFGINYNGDIIPPHTALPGMAQPQHYWVPSIAPCGLTVYSGSLFPDWEGDLFVGALAGQKVQRLKIRDGKVIEADTLFSELGVRIRDVRTGPDGALYVVTNGLPGKIIRVVPKTL